jgi:hypothetical protein
MKLSIVSDMAFAGRNNLRFLDIIRIIRYAFTREKNNEFAMYIQYLQFC